MLTFPEMFVQVFKVAAFIVWLSATIIGIFYVGNLYLGDATEKQKKYRLQLLIITTISVLILITFVAYRLQFIKHG
jgi:hypothetical protein